MEVILACLFVPVWAMLIFYEHEKDEPRSQNKSVASPATPNQTVKRGNSSAESITPAQTVKKRDSKHNSVLSASIQPDRRFHRSYFAALPTIIENQEGEDLAAEVENLTAELAKYVLQQQQQSACLPIDQTNHQEEAKHDILCDNMTEVTQERDELQMQLCTLNKVLSQEIVKIQYLEKLLREKEDISTQLAKDKAESNLAIEHLNNSYENRIVELLNELAVAKNTAKPITKEVGCGTELELAVAYTQTEWIAKDVGCGTEEVVPDPPQSRSTGQEVVTDESCGFTLDFQIMQQCKNPRRSFSIPARERTKPPAPAAPKAQVHFPVGDVRYKNKPMSGYVVNSDGTQVIYGGAVPLTRKPTPAIPTNNTEAAGPPALEQPKQKPCIPNDPVKTDDLVVTSIPVERVSLPGNRLMLKNVPGGDYGRIIGGGGSNIRRIEMQYQIVARLNTSPDGNYSFLITGNTEEVRQAAADDIVGGLTVTAEFSNSKLPKRIKNFRLNEIGRQYFVRINRPSDNNGMITLTGRLSSCQSAYAEIMGIKAIN
jgi:hypothetical protein